MCKLTRFVLYLALILTLGACSEDQPVSPTTPIAPNHRADASFDQSKALFQLIPASQSGIDFSNNISETHQLNIITNSYMYNGGGVAILDVNNDDLPDIYFTSSQESNKLYLNQGNFKFKDITTTAKVEAMGAFKTGVTVVDINQDGYDDLYVCRTGIQITNDRKNLLFINNKDNTFTDKAEQYGLADLSGSNHANFFDYDLDGDLDMYLLNHPIDFKSVNSMNVIQVDGKLVRKADPKAQYESDQFYRNDGGTFTNISQAAGIFNRGWGLSATVADFNGDAYPDIYIGNDYIEPDYLYINNKRGGFRESIDQYMRHTSNHTMGVDIADVNNDTQLDLVALDMMAEDNPRQKALMTTMMTKRYNSLSNAGYGHQMMRNVLQLGQRGGKFQEVGEMSGISNTDWSWSALFGDYDNDGMKDLYVTNGYRRDVTDLDYLNYTVDSLNRTGGITPARFPDFNQFLNLIPSNPLPNYIFQNKGNLDFAKQNNQWIDSKPSYSNGAAYADFDKDGNLDLVVNNIDSQAFLYKNNGSNNNYLQITLEGDKQNKDGIGAEVWIKVGDQIQYQQMTNVRGFFSSVEPILHFGIGKAQQVDDVQIKWGKGKVQHLGKQAANQRITIKKSDAVGGKILYRKEVGAGNWAAKNTGIDFKHQEDEYNDFDNSPLIPHAFSRLGPALAQGDMNSDGRADLFIGGGAGQAGQVYLQGANGQFSKQDNAILNQDNGYEDNDAMLFDADGDKDLDLIVIAGSSQYDEGYSQNEDRLYINDGKGIFSKGTFPKTNSSGACAHAVDFDSDGDMDIIIGSRVKPGSYPVSPSNWVLQNDGGQFTDVSQSVGKAISKAGMINEITSTDINGDGKIEVLLTGEFMSIETYAFNGQSLEKQSNAMGNIDNTGWWNCLKVADVDGDGDMDILAGNLGNNSRLSAPLSIYAKDFDGNNQIDPVLTWMDNGKEYPLARREVLAKQMPMLNKKFKYFKPYSRADINEIFTKEQMQGVMKLTANELQSCWFENTGSDFIKHVLPMEAQVAPIQDFAVVGKQIIAVGNDYGSDTETGRLDASNGLVMGYTNGQLKVVAQNGFKADKEARAIEAVSLANGKTMIIVVNNNDIVQGFID